MVDFLLDDVKELLLKEKGDAKILERIKRAAENGEVISVYERQYVKDLAEKYLRPKREVISEPEKTKPATIFTQTEKPKPTHKPKPKPKTNTQKPLFESKSNPKTTKIAFGIGGIALAIILIIGASQSGIEFDSSEISSTTTSTKTSSSGFKLETDSSSYSLGDIISISGTSDAALGKVTLSITNTNGKEIWNENVAIKSSGTFSTLVIAGGSGWESSGEYQLKSLHGSEEVVIDFEFKG